MKKLRLLVVGLLSLATVSMAHTSPVGATPNPPHDTTRYYSHGSCAVYFMHGNIWGSAYAKFTLASVGTGCHDLTYVKVTGWNGSTYVNGGSCSIARCNPSSGGWYSSTASWSNLLGSTLYLRDNSGSSRTFNFSGI